MRNKRKARPDLKQKTGNAKHDRDTFVSNVTYLEKKKKKTKTKLLSMNE